MTAGAQRGGESEPRRPLVPDRATSGAGTRSEALLRLAELAADVSLDEFLRLAAARLAQSVESTMAALYLRQPSGRFVAMCSIGLNGVDPQDFFPQGESLADARSLVDGLIDTKRPVVINDPRLLPPTAVALWKGFGRAIGTPIVRRGEVIALAVASGKESDYLPDDSETLQIVGDLIVRVAELDEARGRAEESAAAYRRTIWSVVEVLAKVTGVRDPYTAAHQRSVAELSVAIGRRLGWADDQLDELLVAGALHDVGKVAVPGEILSRPGQLTDIEMQLVRTHCQVGADIIQGLQFPWDIRRPILEHHERLDGSGYPYGLKGRQIAMTSRIVSVADVFDAMSSARPYRSAFSVESAVEELNEGAGRLYDAEVVSACVAHAQTLSASGL